MKSNLLIIFSLVMVALTSNAYDCKQKEAQFMGTVVNVQKDYLDQNVVECYFQIEFSSYSPHALCPLDYLNAASVKHLASSCQSVKEGDEVSGVLVQKNSFIYIE